MRNIAYGATILFTVAVAVMELFLEAPVLLLFGVASLALVGLAWVLGQATESVGHYAGPRIGGIMNATFGNAAELIITIFALSAGLTTVVKASIIGSVIGNVLLVLGASLLIGGLKNGTQSFSPTIAGGELGDARLRSLRTGVPDHLRPLGSGRRGAALRVAEHQRGGGPYRPLCLVPALLLPQTRGSTRARPRGAATIR